MAEVADRFETYGVRFDALRRGAGAGPEWLRARREAAFDRFVEAGFPTTRQEEWRFTNVAPIADTPFAAAEERGAPALARLDLEPFLYGGAVGAELVFVDGRFAPVLSALDRLPRGVTVERLVEATAAGPEHAPVGALTGDLSPFVALNTACFEDGALLRVAPKAVVEHPIHLLFVTVSDGGPVMACPRIVAMIGEGAEARLVETHASLGGGATFGNAVAEYHLAAGAIVDHCRIVREQATGFHVGGLFVRSGRAASFTSQSIVIGGRIVRNDVVSVLAGEGAETTLNGLYVATGDSLVDNHTTIDHAEPHCPSHELYKGILAGRSKAVFNGKVIVRPQAQKTDAKQTNKALLLSDDASINTKPQLEIFADDVKCTHGAAIGQMDDDAIFYLRARGIGERDARAMMIHAFAGEVLNRITETPVRDCVERALFARLGVEG